MEKTSGQALDQVNFVKIPEFCQGISLGQDVETRLLVVLSSREGTKSTSIGHRFQNTRVLGSGETTRLTNVVLGFRF